MSDPPRTPPVDEEPERDWTIEVFLVAVHEQIDHEEIRQHWKANEAPRLDAIIASSPVVRLGTSEVPLPANDGLRGPVGRVLDLLNRRGTTPDYALPVVDAELCLEILAALRPEPGDPPFKGADDGVVEAFLKQNVGAGLTYRDELLHPW